MPLKDGLQTSVTKILQPSKKEISYYRSHVTKKELAYKNGDDKELSAESICKRRKKVIRKIEEGSRIFEREVKMMLDIKSEQK